MDDQWLLCIPGPSEGQYYSQSNLALKSHHSISNYLKYQLADSLTISLTIPILLWQSMESLTLF